MNEQLITELVKRIQQLERRVEYLETETAEKNTFSTITVDDYLTAEGGIHVGGTSDPGTDNLLVDREFLNLFLPLKKKKVQLTSI